MTDRPQWLYMNAGQALANDCWSGIADDQRPPSKVDALLRESVAQMAARLFERLECAAGVIASAGGGDWTNEHPKWQEAAGRWRDECWHATLEEAGRTEPEEQREEQPAEQRGPTITELLSGQWEGKEVLPAREITSPRGPIIELTGSEGHEMDQGGWLLRDEDDEVVCRIDRKGKVVGDIDDAVQVAADTRYAPFWKALRRLNRDLNDAREMLRGAFDVIKVLTSRIKEKSDT